MRHRLERPLALIVAAALLGACPAEKKTAPAPAPAPKAAAKKIAPTPAPKKAESKPTPVVPAKLVRMVLTRTALSLELPEGSKVGAAIIGGADQVSVPGYGKMVVKPRLLMDKELEKLVPWAKSHQIQKFQAEMLKEGKGKTYTYMYKVILGATPQVVYHQMFQKRGKDYVCFANAKSETAARAFKKACDSIAIAKEPKAK